MKNTKNFLVTMRSSLENILILCGILSFVLIVAFGTRPTIHTFNRQSRSELLCIKCSHNDTVLIADRFRSPPMLVSPYIYNVCSYIGLCQLLLISKNVLRWDKMFSKRLHWSEVDLFGGSFCTNKFGKFV